MKPVVLVLVLVVVAVATTLLVRKGSMRRGEILPAGEMRERYGHAVDQHPEIAIEPAKVPANLRDLIPMAEYWGIGDDLVREDREGQASTEQRLEFQAALRGRTAEVTAWLDSYGNGAMPEEAGHYMYMLQALDEMGLWPD